MAVFLAISSREIISKIVSIWFPVMCFVGLGTDHVIANMYFIPLAIFLGSEDISVSLYIWKSMIPSFLGNFIGGAVFTGVIYWYLYLEGNEVEIHFDGMAMGVMQGERQMVGSHIPSVSGGPSSGNGTNGAMWGGMPDSGNMGRSGLAKDYHVDQFGKEKADSAANGVTVV
jgi:hypothetical protein